MEPITTFEDNGDGTFTIRQTQDDVPIVQANFVEKLSRDNGFSKKRLFRKVASIPVVAVTEAERQGYNMSNEADVRAFLKKHPEFMTVKGLKTDKPAGIIVK